MGNRQSKKECRLGDVLNDNTIKSCETRTKNLDRLIKDIFNSLKNKARIESKNPNGSNRERFVRMQINQSEVWQSCKFKSLEPFEMKILKEDLEIMARQENVKIEFQAKHSSLCKKCGEKKSSYTEYSRPEPYSLVMLSW